MEEKLLELYVKARTKKIAALKNTTEDAYKKYKLHCDSLIVVLDLIDSGEYQQ